MNPEPPQPEEDEPQVYVLKSKAGQWRISRRQLVEGGAVGAVAGALAGCDKPEDATQAQAAVSAVPVAKKTAHDGAVTDMVVCGALLYSCSLDGKVKVWSLNSGRPSGALKTGDGARSIHWRRLVLCDDGVVAAADARQPVYWRIPEAMRTGQVSVLDITASPIPTTSKPVAGSQRTLMMADTMPPGFSKPTHLAVTHDSGMIAALVAQNVSLQSGGLYWFRSPWNLSPALKTLHEDRAVTFSAMAVGEMQNQAVLALARAKTPGTVRFFAVPNAAPTTPAAPETHAMKDWRRDTPLHEIRVLAFSPRSGVLVAGDNNGSVAFMPPGSDTTTSVVLSPASAVTSLDFSQDESLMAVGCSDGRVHLIQPADGKLVRSFEAHAGTVNAVRFCSFRAAQRLVTGGDDKMICVWNLSAGALEMTLDQTAPPEPAAPVAPLAQQPAAATPAPSGGGPSSPPRSSGDGPTYHTYTYHYWRPN